jgi:predicted transcriptional regulator
MQTNTAPLSVKLSKALRDRIKNLADARNQSAHAMMVQAIENYVDREEKREALRQEARAAHEHFMLTGLHLTNTDVAEWIDKLARGEKASMPKCHI